ncbi:MAG: MFS transporter [Armatimonadetes bacterium]|jgi:sugar phosphate permease|nr:MFS transporter [Armatimonadota bacterium]
MQDVGSAAPYRRVFWSLWGGYFAFYLCRLNLAAALPAIMVAQQLTRSQAGWIGSGFFACYGLGQLLNGHNTDRYGPRAMLSLGLFGSAVLCLAFGLSSGLPLLVGLWALNGVCQSAGWPSCVRAMADWFPAERRGKLFGLFATSYHTGTVVALLLAGWLCDAVGWRAAFLVPALPVAVVALFFRATFRDRPKAPTAKGSDPGQAPGGRGKGSLLHPRVLLVGLATSALSVVGYGFLFWTPTYLAETRGLSTLDASTQSLFLAVAGAASVAFTGWATDALFRSRRMPLVVMMTLVAALLVLLLPRLPIAAGWQVMAYLGAVGFFSSGPHGLLVGAVAMDLVPQELAGRAAGLLDAFGYLGAVLTGAGTGWLAQHRGWPAVFPVWAASLALAAVLCSFLWNLRPRSAS